MSCDFFSRALLVVALASPLSACADSSPPTLAPAPAVATSVATVEDEAPLRSSVARLGVAWNAGSGPKWGAEFWQDGELINILGVAFKGAPAVGAVTTGILKGPFAGSHFESAIGSIRFLCADAAVVETVVDVTNFHALPPGAVATSAGLLRTRLTHVFTRRAGVWHILLSQNTAVLPTPSVTRT